MAEKPKIINRDKNNVTIVWDNIFPNKIAKATTYILQIYENVNGWTTLYQGANTQFKVTNLGPCSFYKFRLSIKGTNEWILFKAATEIENFLVMHMTRAVTFSKTSLIRRIIHCRHQLLETVNRENKTPLVLAVEKGEPPLVNFLLNLGANPNTPILFNNRTPLMIAIYRNRLQIAAILIDKGANINATDINGLNILHFAVDSGCNGAVEFVLKYGVDINSRDNSGLTPLLRAAILNISSDIVKTLLEHGADKGVTDRNGMSFEQHQRLHQVLE